MDAGFIIGEQTCQMMSSGTPVQPKLIAGKTYQHRPHAEGDPAFSRQIAHASVNEGVTRLTIYPCLEIRLVVLGHAQPFKGGVHAVGFYFGLVFDLLDEVATPCQARTKSCQITPKAFLLIGGQLRAAFDNRLRNLANR